MWDIYKFRVSNLSKEPPKRGKVIHIPRLLSEFTSVFSCTFNYRFQYWVISKAYLFTLFYINLISSKETKWKIKARYMITLASSKNTESFSSLLTIMLHQCYYRKKLYFKRGELLNILTGPSKCKMGVWRKFLTMIVMSFGKTYQRRWE